MNIYELELFNHLSKTLQFAKTSREMHISPSALSRTIQRLEEEMDSILFLRDNRTVKITEKGKRFLQFSRETIDSYRTVKEDLQSEKEDPGGVIRIYASVTASYTLLSDILKDFRKSYPKVHIDLHTGSASGAIEQILEGKVDITIAAKPWKLPSTLQFLPLVITPLHFIAPMPPSETLKIIMETRPIDWEKIPFILSDKGVARKTLNSWFKAKEIKPEIYAVVSGNEAIIAMVALGFGVGVVPKIVIDQSLSKGNIQIIKNAPKLDPYTVGICTSRRLLKSPGVKSFWKTAENQAVLRKITIPSFHTGEPGERE